MAMLGTMIRTMAVAWLLLRTAGVRAFSSCTSSNVCGGIVTQRVEALAGGLSQKRARNLLQRRHIKEFEGNTLFDQFARVVCSTNSIRRKELFEAWYMASSVHKQFPETRRVADLACSHGLVSWALLLLCKESNASAICVDIRMPRSAEKIAAAMLEHWPSLKDRWDYVEGSLDRIVPSSSTLLVGVHACGGLSDKVISLAIQGGAPLALVPCCHSLKALPPEERDELKSPRSEHDLAEYIDNNRIRRLEEAGMHVQEGWIPEKITPKNRVLFATPGLSKREETEPFLMPLFRGRLPIFSIPVEDTPEAKATVRSLSGREAANQRKLLPPPSLCLSMFLPVDGASGISEASLTTVGRSIAEDVAVEAIDPEPFLHSTGRYSMTFRLIYNGIPTKEAAKDIHTSICQKILEVFPGSEVR